MGSSQNDLSNTDYVGQNVLSNTLSGGPHSLDETNDQIWKILFLRHTQQLKNTAPPFFIPSVSEIFSDTTCPKIEDINAVLKPHQWTSYLVLNPISYKEMFSYYAQKVLPLPVELRGKKHLEYSKVPDFFIRCFTQIPLLLIDEYRKLLEDFGRISLLNTADPIEFNEWLTRLYWHSLEKGILNISNEFYAVGSLLLGSPEESVHATVNASIKPFGMHPVIRTPISYDKHAPLYYSFDNFSQIRKSLLEFEKLYKNA